MINNLKYKTKLHQLKVEFLKIQKINNLKQRCKKNKNVSPKNLAKIYTYPLQVKRLHIQSYIHHYQSMFQHTTQQSNHANEL